MLQWECVAIYVGACAPTDALSNKGSTESYKRDASTEAETGMNSQISLFSHCMNTSSIMFPYKGCFCCTTYSARQPQPYQVADGSHRHASLLTHMADTPQMYTSFTKSSLGEEATCLLSYTVHRRQPLLFLLLHQPANILRHFNHVAQQTAYVFLL